MKLYDTVHIGNYTKDTIINKGVSRIVDGGGFNYGARAAVSFKKDVAVVTKLAEKDSHVIDKLKENGIDTYPVYCDNSTCMVLEYYSDNPDERNLKITSLADSFTVEDIENVKGKAYIFAPSLKGEVPEDVIEYFSRSSSLVAIDAQGFIRILNGDEIAYKKWDEAESVFPMVDILKVDIKEAEFITSISDRYEALKKLHAMGSKETILTYRDGAAVYNGKDFFEEKFKPKELLGRSGRGDTSISSYTAARLEKDIPEALKWSVALTSLKLEKEGPFDRTAVEVEELIARSYR